LSRARKINPQNMPHSYRLLREEYYTALDRMKTSTTFMLHQNLNHALGDMERESPFPLTPSPRREKPAKEDLDVIQRRVNGFALADLLCLPPHNYL